ncbi:unnamed protein product, partial [Adineta steineri]
VKIKATTCAAMQTGGYYTGDIVLATGTFNSSAGCLAGCQQTPSCIGWRIIVSINACYFQSSIMTWVVDATYNAGSCLYA